MSKNNTDTLRALYKKYSLNPEDVFKHKHFTIITRQGIEKIENGADIDISYEVINCEPTYCVIKAKASDSDNNYVETFGSALNSKAGGTTHSFYVMEMAEKRALSRAVLKLAGFYKLGHYGEDESEDFSKSAPTTTQYDNKVIKRLIEELKSCDVKRAREIFADCEAKEKDTPNSRWIPVMDFAIQEFGSQIGGEA